MDTSRSGDRRQHAPLADSPAPDRAHIRDEHGINLTAEHERDNAHAALEAAAISEAAGVEPVGDLLGPGGEVLGFAAAELALDRVRHADEGARIKLADAVIVREEKLGAAAFLHRDLSGLARERRRQLHERSRSRGIAASPRIRIPRPRIRARRPGCTRRAGASSRTSSADPGGGAGDRGSSGDCAHADESEGEAGARADKGTERVRVFSPTGRGRAWR